MSSTSSPQSEINPRRALAIGLAFLLLYTAWLAWGRGDALEQRLAGGLAMLFSGGVAAWAAFRAWKGMEAPRQDLKKPWQWLLAAALLGVTADGVRLLLLLRQPAGMRSSQPLDLLFLAVQACLWMGLLRYPLRTRPSFSPIGRFMDSLITSAGMLTLVWMIAIQPVMGSILLGRQVWSAVFYPLADLISVLLLVNLFLFADLNRTAPSLAWLSLALLASIAGDISFISTSVTRGYLAGGASDLAWVVSDAFFLLAAWQAQRASAGGASLIRRLMERLQGFLPLLTVLLLAWYTVLLWQWGGRFEQTGLWVAALLGLILVGRQGLQAGEVEMQRYASLVNSVAEPAFVCDRSGALRLANPALARAFGLPEDGSLAGRRLDEVFDLQERTAAVLQESLETGWSGETFLRRSTGEPMPVYLSLRPLQPASGERLALAGTAHDLSEVKRQQAALEKAYAQIAADRAQLEKLNRELEDMVEEKTASLSEAYLRLEEQNRTLQELDRLKSDFVSLVSHELRAPLTNISGGIELLLSSSQALPPRAGQNLQLVQAEIQRLTRFVETILDLQALEAGKMPLYPAPLHLGGLAAALQRQMLPRPGLERIRWQIPSDLPPALADEQALSSVLFHLLDNALKYAPQGAIFVRARLQEAHPACEGRRIVLEVQDEGAGIAPEALAHLFDRFYRQSSDSQEVYGHGLGLYIVRRLLEAMGGSIEARNCPEGGACFVCCLPVAEDEAGEGG